MRYLKGDELLFIHFEIIEGTGGAHGMRDVGLFLSLLERPKTVLGGKEMYPGAFQKAAAYCEGFARYHVFVDGNKRTAMAAAARFLEINGHAFSVTNKEMESFALRIVIEKLSLADITDWFKRHNLKAS